MTEPSPSGSPENEQRLNAIIAEYLKRKDTGQDVNKDAMLKAYPDFADGLRSYFQGEAMLGENSPALAATKLSPTPLASDIRETLKPGTAQADTASEFGNRRFGRYQILRPLGEGAMGSVYLALDTTLDRQVALKVPKTEGTANAEFMARFTREAKAAAGLKHSNICSVYDAGQHEGTAYITMDFIDGVPLSRYIGTEKLKAVDGILQMISIIADAVGHAHSKGVIHRDLKPGNILVDADFKPHVTDFGLARRAGGPADESRITQEGLLIGTPAYMAPEQVKGEQSKVGPQSDIYSLGVILFELLTCQLPFEGKVPEMLAKVLRDDPPVPSRIRKDLTEDMDDLCLKMLEKAPGRRFRSISEVMSKIETLRNKLRDTSAISSHATAQQKSPFEIQKAHIELMLKNGQYAAAIQDLEKLAQETLPGAKVAAAWAKTKLPTVKKEARALSPSGLQALLKTAHQMFQKSDYIGCAQLIEEIPPLRRTEAMEDLRDKSNRREAEAEQLLLAIKDKERREEIDGIETLVRKLLKLKPGSAYAKRLSEALQSYSKTPPTRRKYRYEKGRLQGMPEPSFLRQWAVLGSLIGILVFLSVYSYVIFYLKSGNQILAVHVDDEWLKSQGGEVTLVVDGDNHTIATPKTGGDPITVTVSLGQHTFSVKHGDTIVHDPRQFTIEKDGRKVLSITATDVRLENGVPASGATSESVASNNVKSSAVPEPKKQATDNADWISLFDGRDLTGWVRSDNQVPAAWKVENEYMEVIPGSGNIMTSRSFPLDFQLHVEFWIPKEVNKSGQARGNSGVFLLGRHEIQIVDVFENPEPQPTNMTIGALYKSVEPQGVIAKPPETWQTFDITFHAPRFDSSIGKDEPGLLTVKHDGKVIVDNAAVNEKFGPGGSNTDYGQPGSICLQDHFSPVRFRNIRIRELSPASESEIPGGAEVFAGHSYKFYNESLSWSEAMKKCESMGGHLPIVESAAQNEFLVRMADKNFSRENRTGWESIWLGMTDKETEGDWRWVDGKPLGYTNWFQLQPNNNKEEEHFGLLWLSSAPGEITGQWCDQPDHTQKHVMAFVCEWDTERAEISHSSSAANPPLLAIAPFEAAQAKHHQEVWATHLGQPVEYANSIGMKLRLIPPGEFMMGSPAGEAGRAEGEGPLHPVRLTQPFYMGMTEVTQSQWFAVMGTRPWQVRQSTPEGNDYPATFVSWNDAVAFCEKMSSADGVTYRLPTEAEWEFACRAGTSTEYSFGSDVGQLGEFAWTVENADHTAEKYAHSVGTKRANSFGLSDMHGNVYELCQDHMGRYIGGANTAIDPMNSPDGEYRVTRGGAWDCGPFEARSATRGSAMPDFYSRRDGFRVVRVVHAADSGSATLHDKKWEEPEIPDPNASLKNISQVHGATAEELVTWTKTLPAAGYRPYCLSVRGNTNSILYDAVASKTTDQSEWIIQLHEYGDWDDWEKMTTEYRPALLNVYAKNNAYERLVLWVKDDAHNVYWYGSDSFMEEKLKEGLKWDQGAKSNRERWLPTSVAGHWVDGSPEYHMMMTWLPYHQCEWSLDLPLDELPALVEKYREKGWQPAHLNIIYGSSPARCIAVFGDNPEDRKWTFSPKLSVNEYRSMLTKVDDLGGQPQSVFSRVENDEIVYSVLWHGVEL